MLEFQIRRQPPGTAALSALRPCSHAVSLVPGIPLRRASLGYRPTETLSQLVGFLNSGEIGTLVCAHFEV